MIKIVAGIGAILLLTGTQASATYYSLIDLGQITIGKNTYTISEKNISQDIYIDEYRGYSSGTSGPGVSSNYNTDYFTGFYLGTITGNDIGAKGTFDELIKYYLTGSTAGSVIDLSFVTVDKPDTTETSGGVTLAVEYLTVNKFYGTWTVHADPQVEVSFYTVKGANEYALYFVDPSRSTGYWSTKHLENKGGNQPAISHITVQTDPAVPIPEPATTMLFALGAVGFAGLARRRGANS